MVVLPNKLLSSTFTCFTTTVSSHTVVRRLLIPLSSSVPPPENAEYRKPHFIADYLVATCAFSTEKAAQVSTHLCRIKSLHQPDAVIDFFRTNGFNDDQIRTLISLRPMWLAYDVEKTLQPRLHALQGLGFTPADTIHLVLSYPDVINNNFSRTVLPQFQVWISLLGSTDCLMKFLKKKQWILGYSVSKTILPNLALLRSYGIPDERISMVVKHHPRFITQRPSSLKAHAEAVEGLGIPRESGMFLWALQAIRMVSKDRFKAKMELMKSMGWSEGDFLAAFRKAPVFLSVSEEKMRKKMEFFVNEAGCEPAYLALHPVLLMYSLEKRLIPRYRVMEILKSKGLRGGTYTLNGIMNYSEKKFMEKFVLYHKEEAPQLCRLYITDEA